MNAKRLTKEELLRGLLELLGERESEPSPYYTQDDSPLGRRRHLELIRSGVIKGWEDGRKKFARREDVKAFVAADRLLTELLALHGGTCRDEVVYFATAGRFVKVGVSCDPQRRMANLQTSNAERVKLITSVPGTARLEHAIHESFREWKRHGEWFDVCPDLVWFIRAVRARSSARRAA